MLTAALACIKHPNTGNYQGLFQESVAKISLCTLILTNWFNGFMRSERVHMNTVY